MDASLLNLLFQISNRFGRHLSGTTCVNRNNVLSNATIFMETEEIMFEKVTLISFFIEPLSLFFYS